MADAIDYGIDLCTGCPVQIPREVERVSHSIVFGKSRSKKTSLFLTHKALQLITPAGSSTYDNVFVGDPGGDLVLAHRLAAKCKATGRRLAVVSSNDCDQSLYFDFFTTEHPGSIDTNKRANALLEGLSISKLRVYGQQYYWTNQIVMALDAIRETLETGRVLTLATVAETMQRRRNDYRDADQILLTVKLLLSFRVLNFDEPRAPEECVSFTRMDQGEVLLAHCPTLANPSAGYLLGLLLYSLVADRMERVYRGENPPHTHVILDEVGTLASQAWSDLLCQCAKYRITLHMAAQSWQALALVEKSLPEILLTNTGVQIFLTPDNEPELLYIQHHARDASQWLRSRTWHTYAPPGGTVPNIDHGERESLVPSLSKNMIVHEIAKRAGCAIMIVRDKTTPREPILLFQDHDIPRSLAERLSNTPLARRLDPAPIVSPGVGWRFAVRDEAFRERERLLAALYAKKLAGVWRG